MVAVAVTAFRHGADGGDHGFVEGLSPGTARVSHDLGRLGLGLEDDGETVGDGADEESVIREIGGILPVGFAGSGVAPVYDVKL